MGEHYGVRSSGADKTSYVDNRKSGYPNKPGCYEAKVVGHVEGSRSGELLVKIIEESGRLDSLSEKNAVPAAYASPFYGRTFLTDTEQLPDSPSTAGQSYGMWMVPPDIGSKVLIMYLGGGSHSDRCFWFACVYDSPSHHMVPAISRAVGGPETTRLPKIDIPVTGDSVFPVVEYSTNISANEEGTTEDPFGPDAIEKKTRWPHEYQASVLVMQGLDKDPVRGAISSSSMREVPSNVYGISTPGRKATQNDQIPGNEDLVIMRKGGHTFVMDDGDNNGKDQLIRLRTTGGHQILMNDTEHILYIASDSGNHWMEFSSTGQINVYARGGYNLRTDGPINFHSESMISMNAPIFKVNASGNPEVPIGSITMNTSGTFSLSAIASAAMRTDGIMQVSALGYMNISAGGRLSVGAIGQTNITGAMINLNCGEPAIPGPALPTFPDIHKDVKYLNKQWVPIPGGLASICTVVPCHEPWVKSNGQRYTGKKGEKD